MKTKTILAIALFLLILPLKTEAQVKYLNDPSIVAQHKRMVFEQWGDWRPYPKYLFGIQTNFAYATVWGNWAPSKNRKYKNGSDIRPLKPNGFEVKRYAELEIERNDANKIFERVNAIKGQNEKDFLHYTAVTVEIDPLWLLYYKKMLRPLNNFPENPSYSDLGIETQEKYNLLVQTGAIESLLEILHSLKDSYHQSRNMAMPRGKRILMYHDTLVGWRKFLDRMNSLNKKVDLSAVRYNENIYQTLFNVQQNPSDDKDIVEAVMLEYKHKF